MSDQNNAPERIWIKPCDPCENPYDYYVCDPRYLDGRETSYVKSIVSCSGCGGGLRRQSGQFVCSDCGKAETVQEVLARADRAAPTDNTALVEEMENLRDRNGKPPLTKEEMARFRELFPLDYLSRVALAAWVNVRPDQLPKEMQAHNCPATMEAWGRVAEAIRTALTPTDNTALVERLTYERDEARAQVVGAFEAAASVAWADRESGLTVNTKIRALTPDDAQATLQSMLDDAERDMRQRAADSCLGLMTAQSARKFILALPLKHGKSDNG